MTAGEGNSALLKEVFPEGAMSLKEADPELYSIIKDEKHRQRYVCGPFYVWPLRLSDWPRF
jgi:hypothetical protein